MNRAPTCVHHADVLNLKGTSYRLKNHQPVTSGAHWIHTTVALFSVGVNSLGTRCQKTVSVTRVEIRRLGY